MWIHLKPQNWKNRKQQKTCAVWRRCWCIFFLAGFGFWLLASGFWLLAPGFWLWLLAFGFFWLRTSGFCGFWLGCNSAWIFFILCLDLLYISYQFFLFRPWVSLFLYYGCHAILHEYLIFCINYLHVFQPGFVASVAFVDVFFVVLPFFTCLSICLSFYPSNLYNLI